MDFTDNRTATECKPKAKRRRACKDCTCGLAERLELEDKQKRAEADKALNTLKLQADDLAEVDFTVQGKVGSCGNCSLGGKIFLFKHKTILTSLQMHSVVMVVHILVYQHSSLVRRFDYSTTTYNCKDDSRFLELW